MLMRTPADRVRHAISFELTALLLVMTSSLWIFDKSLQDIGVIALAGSLIAAVWVYAYNYLFDAVLVRLQGSPEKTVPQRVVHSILFEASLLVIMLPIIAWHMQIPLLEALIMDAALAGFYVVYAFCFNWLYDRRFPIPADTLDVA